MDRVNCLQIGEENTMNTGPVSISRAVSLRSLTLLPLYSIQFPWQRAECCWRSSSQLSRADCNCYSISLQTKQARETQEARSAWTADGDVMWLWRQNGAVTESAPVAWRVCKNTHLMRVSSCESHLLTFNPELFCLVKQRKNCPKQTVTICDIILKGHRYFLLLRKKGNTLKLDLVLVHSDAHSWCCSQCLSVVMSDAELHWLHWLHSQHQSLSEAVFWVLQMAKSRTLLYFCSLAAPSAPAAPADPEQRKTRAANQIQIPPLHRLWLLIGQMTHGVSDFCTLFSDCKTCRVLSQHTKLFQENVAPFHIKIPIKT